MRAILFSANPKKCNMNDVVDHLNTHARLYFSVNYRINSSAHSFPINGFVHVSGSGDQVQYVARIEDIVLFSPDHFKKLQPFGYVKPMNWIEEWQANKDSVQPQYERSIVITKIDRIEPPISISAFRNVRGKPAKAPRNYCRVDPPKEWASPCDSASALVEDFDSIRKQQNVTETEKEALISARVGQGFFRTKVLQLWGYCCSVTGSATQAAIRASHIKPWRESTNDERLDPQNGLPLVASLDALFDAGLISFESSGRSVVSPKLSQTEQQIFGIGAASLRKKPTGKMAEHLAYHRRKHGLQAEPN
jgi:hypothetical protein